MSTLRLALNAVYFRQISSGDKVFEFRQRTAFWAKRIVGRSYTHVTVTSGYPKTGDAEKTLTFPYLGYEERSITHEHFGPDPVDVFAIRVGSAWRVEAGVPILDPPPR